MNVIGRENDVTLISLISRNLEFLFDYNFKDFIEVTNFLFWSVFGCFLYIFKFVKINQILIIILYILFILFFFFVK